MVGKATGGDLGGGVLQQRIASLAPPGGSGFYLMFAWLVSCVT